MRASRLLSILLLLQVRERVTADELAAEFEVSPRTIYRDVEELSAAGVPIYGDRGPGGGFQLLDGYRTKLTGIAHDEAEAMFLIGMPGAAEALGMGGAVVNAARKLLASLPPPMSASAGRMSARFYLDPLEWYQASEPVAHLPALARAVLDRRAVSIVYESWTATRTWRVEPLGLVQKAGVWYLVADSAKGVRTFKVAGIREQMVTQETFDRPADFDLPAHWHAQLERFESQLRRETALLSASPLALTRLARLGAYAARAVQAAQPADAGGWALLRLPFETIDQAALLLLGLGPEVTVLEPAELRTRLGQLAREIARLAG